MGNFRTSINSSGTTTYTFDADGNQQLVQAPSGDRTTTVWNYENKTTLVQLPTGIRNTMAYEPDGLRVKLEESTGTKKFIWDDQNYLAESDESNDINVVYTNEPNTYGNLVSQYRKSGAVWAPSYYHFEALGSTRELTDDSEAVTDTYIYDAWGNVISSSGSTVNPFQFTGNVGYYFDVDTENQYIRARIYSPIIGRWMSVDPIGFEDGINLYLAYFLPNLIDADGARVTIARIGQPLLEPRCDSLGASVSWKFSVDPWPCRTNVGYFVQKVTVTCQSCNCKERVIPGGTIKPCRPSRATYYESWKVFRPRGNNSNPAYAIDTASAAPKNLRGQLKFPTNGGRGGWVRWFVEIGLGFGSPGTSVF